MKSEIAKTLFALAKSPVGDVIVGLAFGRLSGALPVQTIKTTERVIAFWHPRPYWEKHILIVPKKPIRNLASLKADDMLYVSEAFAVAAELVRELGWDKDAYSVLVNGGSRQEVNQLHFHLSSGEPLS